MKNEVTRRSIVKHFSGVERAYAACFKQYLNTSHHVESETPGGSNG